MRKVVRRPGRLKLEPLSQAGVIELAARHGVDGEELYRKTAGNPFFVTEVLAAGDEQIPETVRDAVLARAARLSAPAQRLLEAVAVVPGQVELWLLEDLADEPDEPLDECLASGMLSPGRAHVAFRHELARLAIEEAIAPNRRLALHRAAIGALAARGGDDPAFARLAHHAEAAGNAEGVLRWAPRAAERAAASGAHREAAAQYARTLRFADGLPVQIRAELLHGRVEECRLSAQFDEALDAQNRDLECRRELGDQLGEGDSLRSLSRLLFFVGRTREGEPLALQAVELLEQLPAGHELAMAYGNLSQRRMVVEDLAERMELDRGRWDEAGESAASVLRDPRSPPVARAWALPTLGLLRARRGDSEAAAPLADAHWLVDSTEELMQIVPVAAARAESAWLCGDHMSVEHVTDAALALALQRRAAWAVGELTYWRWQAGLRDELPAEMTAGPYQLSIAGEWARAAEAWRTIGCPYEAALALAESDEPLTVRQSIDELLQLGARPPPRSSLAGCASAASAAYHAARLPRPVRTQPASRRASSRSSHC